MGTLYLVSTPIGNLDDITIRAIHVLFSVDAIACEDTRRTGLLIDEIRKRHPALLDHTKTATPQLIRFDETTEDTEVPDIIELLEDNCDIALVSDAGTPLINDPGYILVREARKRNVNVVPIPGASAILAALVASGLPIHTFSYLGYPPEKSGPRKKLFQRLRESEFASTYVLYCAPHKLVGVLTDLEAILGDIRITVARELTKVHEEFWTGTVSSAKEEKRLTVGELVILFSLPS